MSSAASKPRRHPTKVLVFVEENHAYREMRSHMPYLASLARRYSFASHYRAISHPSLPNYLALTGGSTFGVRDDNVPKAHRIRGRSVFDQALNRGKTAKTYVDSMPTSCATASSKTYAVKHNPWPYFTGSRRRCRRFDVAVGRPRSGALHQDIVHGSLPNVGFVIPNLCHDAHDCSLARADRWLKTWVPRVFKGRDFRSGRLAVVVTADEDDHSAHNTVLTVAMHAGMQHRRVTRPLTHYSLLGYVDHVLGAHLLGHAKGGFASAFGL
jgi:acid phosphatase